MNEIFNYNRFWRYFKYDFLSILREQGTKLASVVIVPSAIYVLMGIANLIFNGHWNGGGAPYRISVFIFMSIWYVMAFAGSHYGKITDRKPAVSWIMLPASVTEKFVSMLLNSVVICPLVYFIGYFTVDGILCLLDPSAGESLFSNFVSPAGLFQPIQTASFSMSGLTIPVYVICAFTQVVLAFLLGSIYFKKNKVAKTIISYVGLSIAVMLVVFLCVLTFDKVYGLDKFAQKLAEDNNFVETFVTIAANTLFYLASIVPVAVFGTGIFFRLKSIKA